MYIYISFLNTHIIISKDEHLLLEKQHVCFAGEAEIGRQSLNLGIETDGGAACRGVGQYIPPSWRF